MYIIIKENTFENVVSKSTTILSRPQRVEAIVIFVEIIQHVDVQYIPRNMHTALMCFALLWLCNSS